MRASFLKAVHFLLILAYCGVASHALAASAATALLNAKKEAETRGYIFVTSHDEIVAKAKKEGKMRGLASLEPAANKAMTQGFKKKYPFIDIQLEEIEGTEAFRRFILELKAGRATGWDLNHIAQDFYSEYLPYQKKFDILGMAEQGVRRPQVESIPAAGSAHARRCFRTPLASGFFLDIRFLFAYRSRIEGRTVGFFGELAKDSKMITRVCNTRGGLLSLRRAKTQVA